MNPDSLLSLVSFWRSVNVFMANPQTNEGAAEAST
jgi:hypothetical protein